MLNVVFPLHVNNFTPYVLFHLHMLYPKWKYFFTVLICLLSITLHKKDQSPQNGEIWRENLQSKNQAITKKKFRQFVSLAHYLNSYESKWKNFNSNKCKKRKKKSNKNVSGRKVMSLIQQTYWELCGVKYHYKISSSKYEKTCC